MEPAWPRTTSSRPRDRAPRHVRRIVPADPDGAVRDTVVLECVSGRKGGVAPPESGLTIPLALRAIIDADSPSLAGHILTARAWTVRARRHAGDPYRSNRVGRRLGYNMIRPWPDFARGFPRHHADPSAVDRERKICMMPWAQNCRSPRSSAYGRRTAAEFGRIS